MEETTIRRIKAFTLVELIVVISVIGILMAVLLPALGLARGKVRAVACMSNLRNLGFAFAGYAGDYDGYAVPTVEQRTRTYWWGEIVADGIDHRKGFVWPYLESELGENSVYECPSQRFGSYGLQGKPATEPDDKKWITSTYGYNGYYLCSPASGWEADIGFRPWQKIAMVKGPDKVFAFADTLIDLDSTGTRPILKNTALLDPPFLYEPGNVGNPWPKNDYPTTCFRHNERANVVFIDGHCGSMDLGGTEYVSPAAKVGSVGEKNSPHYVPDWVRWPTGTGGERRRR